MSQGCRGKIISKYVSPLMTVCVKAKRRGGEDGSGGHVKAWKVGHRVKRDRE